jgi:hypothetical protein
MLARPTELDSEIRKIQSDLTITCQNLYQVLREPIFSLISPSRVRNFTRFYLSLWDVTHICIFTLLHDRCHSVVAIPAPGSTYAHIFLCNIPRILCASRLRVPSPCQSAHDSDCRRRSRTSLEVITTQRCVRGGGRGNANMRLLCIPSKPSNAHFMQTGRTWRGLLFLSTWVG